MSSSYKKRANLRALRLILRVRRYSYNKVHSKLNLF